MNWWLLLIPIVGALIGWMANRMVINTLIKRILPQKQSSMAVQAGKLAASEMVSFDAIEKKIAGPEAMDKIMPLVEGHIDNFLRNKLGQAFPMISMFIGDKTINQLKEIFMKEMQEIFPQLMKSYVQNLRSDLDIEKMVTEKIASIPPQQLEAGIRQNLGKELRSFEWVGAGTGLLIGIVQLLLTLVIS
jgi:uncharacterized membrane protein YheB (UPF0754 family)